MIPADLLRRSLGRVAAAVLLAAIGAVGCQTAARVTRELAGLARDVGVLCDEEAGSLERSAAAFERLFEDITPEQEYYLGRAVIATVLQSYTVWDNPAANRYVNLVGQTLARASDKPETFGGYRFLVLDSDEINAFAAPGGLVVVTRGLLRLSRSEDALAAVLAHEIGHVQHRHGLRAIRRGRLVAALTLLGAEAGKHLGSEEIAELTGHFEGAVGDIVRTLMASGYSRRQEVEADAAAVALLRRVGYDPRALTDMLAEMEKGLTPGRPDFARTHPAPRDRIPEIRPLLGDGPAAPLQDSRRRRFERAMLGV